MGELLLDRPECDAVAQAEFIVGSAALAFAQEQLPEAELATIPQDERCLIDIDSLLQYRRPDGTYPREILDHNLQNLFTAVQEAVMEYAVTPVEHDVAYVEEDGRRQRTFMWLGKTALQVAESGYQFHAHPAALERVAIEVDEARQDTQYVRPGYARVFISPKMTTYDIAAEDAKKENLGDKDAIRVKYPTENEQGEVIGRKMLSALVADIAQDDWNAMLADPDNIFGKSLIVQNPQSAKSVMELHADMELPIKLVPEGPISIIEAVVPYIQDPVARARVEDHLLNFRLYNQAELKDQSMNIAMRQQQFMLEMVESIYQDYATPAVETFIDSIMVWSDKDKALFDANRWSDGGLKMSRGIQKRIAAAHVNMSYVKAGIVSGNKQVLEQTDARTASRILEGELKVQLLQQQGVDLHMILQMDMMGNNTIARQNFTVGGGCPGESSGGFQTDEYGNPATVDEHGNAIRTDGNEAASSAEDKSKWEWKTGVCRVKSCPSRRNPDKIKKIKIGPCGICRHCEDIFNEGIDPTKFKTRPAKTTKESFALAS